MPISMRSQCWDWYRIQELCNICQQPGEGVSLGYLPGREASTGSEVEPEGALEGEGRRGAGSFGLVGVRVEGSFPAIS